MPDISRSDSNRSNASRPRVSFNRDVHVKRINGPKTTNAYSLLLDGTHLIPHRKERPTTKKEMTKEAEVVLKQMDKISCSTSTNISPQMNRSKKDGKKNTSLFLTKLNKVGKYNISSSDVDSGSSQELRVYKVNDPICRDNIATNKGTSKSDHESDHPLEENKSNNYKKKIYDFMSLDRKRKGNKKRNLEYLSLERSKDDLNKTKKEKLNKSLIFMTLEKLDGKNKKEISNMNGMSLTQPKNNVKIKPEITPATLAEKVEKKKQIPLFKEEIKNYFEKEKNNIENTSKMMPEKNFFKLNKNVEEAGVKELQRNIGHNNIKTCSCSNIPNNNWELKLNSTITEDLGDGEKNLKSPSPTCDVIYAQVVVSGRSGKTHKPTVNEKAVSDEVGQAIVADKFEKSLNIKIDSNLSYNTFDKSTVGLYKIWQAKSDSSGTIGNKKMEQKNIYENNLSRREPQEDCSRVIRIFSLQNEGLKPGNKSYTDLKNLSIRREILLSRSESQAKERFNSLKKIQEQTRMKKDVCTLNDFHNRSEPIKNETKYFEGTKINEKFVNTLRKTPKEVDLTDSGIKIRKEPKWVSAVKQKDKKEKFKNDKGGHVIKTDDGDDNNNLFRKFNKLGKSKSFMEKKPKSKRMESVKMLFKKKREGKSPDSEDDTLASRYMTYRGSDTDLRYKNPDSSSRKTATHVPLSSSESISQGIKRLSIPTCNESMEALTKIKNFKNKELDWSNSVKNDSGPQKVEKKGVEDISSEATNSLKPTNLRFFGDTDQESITEDHISQQKFKYGTYKSLKTTDLEEDLTLLSNRPESRMTNSTSKDFSIEKHKTKYDLDRPDYGLKQMNYSLQIKNNKFDPSQYSNAIESSTSTNESFDFNGLKYGPSITRSVSSLTQSAKSTGQKKWANLTSTPTGLHAKNNSFSKKVRSHGNLFAQEERIKGRRKQYDSSAESVTEGDSSQHSLKSMIYLHAAAVGDIPGPRNLYKNDRRSQSREELSSIGDSSTILTPHKKTLSRSISVLAPWRPKHNKEDRILYYDSVDYYKSKPPTGLGGKTRSSSKERKANELKFNTLRKENRRRKDVLR